MFYNDPHKKTKYFFVNKFYVIVISFLFSIPKGVCTDKRYLDSCEALLRTTTLISQRINCLSVLSFEYGSIDPRKGILYAKNCIELSKQTKYLKGQLDGFNGMGNAYESLANYDSARWCHINSFEIAKKIGPKKTIAVTLFNIGTCYKEQGKYREALNIYLQAFKILENEESYNFRMHYYLGEMYLLLSDYKQAIYHSKIGFEKLMKPGGEYIAYNMRIILGRCKLQTGEIDSAIYILKNTRTNLKNYTDQISYGTALNALGEAYIAKKNYTEAINCFTEELTIHEKLKNLNGICLTQLNLAYCYALFSKEDLTRINKNLQQAENNLSVIKHNKDALMKAYYKLAKTYEMINSIPMAYSRYKMYSEIKDELLNLERFNQLNELQTKYESEKKEKQIQYQKTNIENQNVILERNRFQIIALIISLAFFILFAYFFYHRYKLKQKMRLLLEIQHQEQLKETALKNKENEERSRIAKDIHDELGSGLSKIMLMSELINKDEIQNNAINNQINSISETSFKLVENMRDLIWAWNPENNTCKNLIARIREYSYDYLEEFPIEFTVITPDEIPDFQISYEVGRHVYMIVKEILQNIVKHAAATQVDLLIHISDNLTIVFKDNGKGFNTTSEFSGNGIKNLRSRCELIGAFIQIKSAINTGTHVTIDIDIDKMKENKIPHK